MNNSTITLVAGLCALLAASLTSLAKYYFASQRPKDFPPGPATVPFLGNLDQLPETKAFIKFVLPFALFWRFIHQL